ncbi:MAG TPA: cation:proton antiporter [Candidatus Sulfotelmatobacter sp.]|nr:cation:proton antiporter [Candidatus Sulfotelmatobacter sp.]
MAAPVQDISQIFIELGAAIVGLAVLARVANRFGFSAIPFYLLAGLAFGNGGLAPLNVSQSFIHTGAEIGVLLLLFMLGVEYTGEELKHNLRIGLPAGAMDFVLNFTPGLIAGFVLGFRPLKAVLLGGITWISSSGVIARIIGELGWMNNPETRAVLSVLVLEDLAMAIYLPLIAVLLAGGSTHKIALAVFVAIATVMVILLIALRLGKQLSGFFAHESDEIILLTTFGAVLLVGGLAQRLQVSAAVGAFLVGIALSGPIAEKSRRLLAPLRDLFAAVFFFFFGMEIDPASLPGMMAPALILGVITAATKILTGYWAARRSGADKKSCLRAGMELVARGEFSIVIAGLGAAAEPQLGPLAAAYVLFLVVLGPVLVRFVRS